MNIAQLPRRKPAARLSRVHLVPEAARTVNFNSMPIADGKTSGSFVVFADGFAGARAAVSAEL